MASENKQIEAVVKAAQQDERNKTAAKAKAIYVKGLEKATKAAQRSVKELRDAPNITQIAIGGTAGLAAGMGGFKAQKYLASTAMGQAVNDEGDATFGAKAIRTGGPALAGIVVTVAAAALIPNGPIAAAVMGAGTGFTGGVLTSAFLDD